MVFSEAANMEEPVYDATDRERAVQRNLNGSRLILPRCHSKPFPAVEVVYKYRLVNTPDKSILALKVTFPPDSSTPPHTHHGASVAVTVLSGAVLNKMNDDPMTIEKAGNSFYEAPGCRHRISDNASKTEEATILATFVMETDKLDAILEKDGPFGLVVIDDEYVEMVMAAMSKK